MNDNLQTVIISGYPICLLIGWLVGNLSGRDYSRNPNRDHWHDILTGIIFLAGVVSTIMMVTAVIMGFTDGVK